MDDCRLANLMAVHKESWKEDLGCQAQNYRPVQPDLDAGEGHGTDHPECHYVALAGQRIRPSQHGFGKVGST